MSKFDLVIFNSKRAEILKRLQRFKEVNFVDINLSDSEDENDEINENLLLEMKFLILKLKLKMAIMKEKLVKY